MNILRIANVPNNRQGGMSRVMYFTGDVLVAQGHSVDYIFNDKLGDGNWLAQRFSLPRRIPNIVRELRDSAKNYDVVEIHEPLAWGYVMQRPRGRPLPPLVVMSYGIEQRFDQLKRAYLKAKGRPVPLKNRLSALSITRPAVYAVRRAQHVLAANMEDVAYLQSLGVPRERVSCYHTGVDPMFWEAASVLPINPAARRGLLFLAMWNYRKGIFDLIPAVTKLLRANPQLTFTAAGVSGADVRSDFPEDVRPRITVVPRINSQEELIAVYARHSIFVLPSMFEGQPLVMSEAAASGLAVVTTSCCGMLDFIRDRQNGLLVRPGDVDALFRALDQLFREDELTERLARAGRETARDFTWKRSAATMLEAYQAAREKTD